MAETLTAQEITALEEMPSVPEMGELRKITTLQDIPLAEGDTLKSQDSQPITDSEREHKLKTNSLKRFFRLSPKKKSGDGPLEEQASHMEFEQGFTNLNPKQQNPTTNKSEIKNVTTEYQRFKLGYKLKESNAATLSHGPKELTASFSKATLKSSLSTYWNAVFKQKKSRKSSKTNIELAEEDLAEASANEEIANELTYNYKTSEDNNNVPADNSVLEDLHKLQISDYSQMQ